MKETRINKFLSEAGYCSRRAADKLIEQGVVTINGVIPQMVPKSPFLTLFKSMENHQ